MRSRSEKEKMLAGESYSFRDPELVAEREKAKELLRLLNAAEEVAERQAILRKLLGGMGEASFVESPFHCTYGKNTHVGDHSYLNFSCIVLDNNEVRIGSRVMIGPAVQIYTAAHPLQVASRNRGQEVAKPVTIGDDVWIGGGAVLLPGVTVGRSAVVGAGAVVTRSVPASTVVAGNPARVIREIEH
ncbi:MAG: sugar O-acetyltransferase [Candidatus Bipolaricaulota bacterium]|nr:MAG: sugar O-acetyltransferase [Candidatus Bipolaricaulota bacterium]